MHTDKKFSCGFATGALASKTSNQDIKKARLPDNQPEVENAFIPDNALMFSIAP